MCSQVITKILKKAILFIVLNFSISESHAQYNVRDSSISFPMIGITFAYQLPGGDLAERFGNNLNVGGVFNYKFRSNWMVGIEGNFLFGENVKEENILDKYLTPDGNIIDGNGEYATVVFYERGFKFDLKLSKIFPIIGPNKNSGLMASVGFGILQHKIRIETLDSPIPYIQDEYVKGYDRLSSGLSITEFIGYMNFGNKRLTNFYAGLEFTQAFTENKRELNFDTGEKDAKSRLDLLFGIRVGWVFPIYRRASDKLYIN